MKTVTHNDLMEKYGNPISHACNMKEGLVFIANGWQKPDGMCDSAWKNISAFVMTLAPRRRGAVRWLDEEPSLRYDFV